MAENFGNVIVNDLVVDSKFSSLLLPNLFYGDWMIPGVTYNDAYETDATGSGGLFVRRLKIAKGKPSRPGADYTNVNSDSDLKRIVLNNSYDRSIKIHLAQEAQVSFELAASYYELVLRQVREDMNQSGLACLYTEGTVEASPSGKTAKTKLLNARAKMQEKKVNPTVVLCSPQFYSQIIDESGNQHTPGINDEVNKSGLVKDWLGFTFVMANGLTDGDDSEYIDYAEETKVVTSANMKNVEFILMEPRTFHCVTSVTSMRMIGSEHFPGQLVQATIINGYRVTNKDGIYVATAAGA